MFFQKAWFEKGLALHMPYCGISPKILLAWAPLLIRHCPTALDSGIDEYHTPRMSEIFCKLSTDFYRATPIHSADYVVARSVRPMRYSPTVEMAKHILKLFSPESSQTILFFRTKLDGNIPAIRRVPVTGESYARNYEKITILDQYRALSRKWCKTEP